MKRYTASICGILTLLSTTLPITAWAKDEHKEAAPKEEHHSSGGDGGHEERHPSGGGGGHEEKRPSGGGGEQRKEQEKQLKEQQDNQRKEQERQQKSQEENQRKEQEREKRAEGKEQHQGREAEEPSGSRNQVEQQNQGQPEDEFRQKPNRSSGGKTGRNGGEPGGFRNGGEPVGARNSGPGGNLNPRNFGPRPASPPPLQGFRPVPIQQAGQPMPHWAGHLNPQQQAQALSAQQNLQNNLVAMPQGQQPQNYQAVQSAAASGYLNGGYQTSLGGQPIVINAGNTYVNPMPQSNWPGWFHPPAPGWGFATGLMLGSIAADLGWFHHGWQPWMGPRPTGFMYPPGYVPTPWIYQPWSNQWVQPGQSDFLPGPPPDYTMPITVEAMEPQQITVMTPVGPEPHWVNQLVMYNAYYYPAYGRWGYVNRQGYFIWVNPQGIMAPL